MVFRRVGRAVMASILALAVGLSFGGCSLVPRGGQTADEAEALIETIEGVTNAEVSVRVSLSGFTENVQVWLQATVADGYEVIDPDAVLYWALQVAWSVNDKQPNTAMTVAFARADGQPVDADWVGAAGRLGFDRDDLAIAGDLYPADLVFLNRADVFSSLLGRWPANVPQTPSPVFVLTE